MLGGACSTPVAHLCSCTTLSTSFLVPTELCVPFQALMFKKAEGTTERNRNLTHFHFPEVYLFTWYLWLLGSLCEVCACMSVCECVCGGHTCPALYGLWVLTCGLGPGKEQGWGWRNTMAATLPQTEWHHWAGARSSFQITKPPLPACVFEMNVMNVQPLRNFVILRGAFSLNW